MTGGRRRERRGAPLFDDGLDPRTISDRRQSPRGGRKALQLCRQVQRALVFALAECSEPVDELAVSSVEPAPNSSRMLVTVASPAHEVDTVPLLSLIQARAGWLRSEVAAAICRRKAPDLIFRLARDPH